MFCVFLLSFSSKREDGLEGRLRFPGSEGSTVIIKGYFEIFLRKEFSNIRFLFVDQLNETKKANKTTD